MWFLIGCTRKWIILKKNFLQNITKAIYAYTTVSLKCICFPLEFMHLCPSSPCWTEICHLNFSWLRPQHASDSEENWKFKNCYAVLSTDEGLVKEYYLKSTRVKPRYNFTRRIWSTGLWTYGAGRRSRVSPPQLFHSCWQGPWSHSRKNRPTGNLDERMLRYNRFSYGVTSAPAVFQRKTDDVQQEVDGVACYLDIQILGRI